MTDDDERVRARIAAAAELALRDPRAALRELGEAATLGERAGVAAIADGLEAMGRVAAGAGELAVARQAFERAAHEAAAAGDALVLARSRAALATLARARPYESSAEAFAAELRFVGDLLVAAHVSLAPAPHLHGARTRLDLRRRIALGRLGRIPAVGRIEVALRLGPTDMLVLAMCAALTVEPELDALLPPAALTVAHPSWTEILAAWVSPATASFDVRASVEAVLDRLEQRALVRCRDDGRPELAPDVESLLGGRPQPVLPENCAAATGTPMWREGPARRAPAGPVALPHVLAIVGGAARAVDHATQLAAAYNWPLWIARPLATTVPLTVRAVGALAREALVHDRVLGLALDALDPDSAAAALAEAAARLDYLVVLAPEALPLPGAAVVPAAPL